MSEIKKKIAVCISGHLRQPIKGYEKFLEMVIAPNLGSCNFDFFIDTWNVDDWRKGALSKNVLTCITPGIIESTIRLYQPVLTRIQHNITFDTSKYFMYVKPGHVKKNSKGEHIPAMYYKIYKSNELKSSYERDFMFEYDLVIRHRSDFALSKPLVFSDDIFEKTKNVIFVADHKNDMESWYTDVFAFSSSKNMDYYSSLIVHLDKLVEKHKIFRPEHLLFHHLNKNQSFNVSVLDYEWEIIS